MSAASFPPIPLCDLRSQYQQLRPELLAAVARVLDSGQVVLGPEVEQFEAAVAASIGVPHAVGCASGSDALSLALAALEIGPGDEVIVPPFTFYATAGAVIRCGATPVFADIDPVSYNIDPERVAQAITPRTKAIMPVHLYGQLADMQALQALAARHHLPLIEDAAQAIGADYQGRQAGQFGVLACFSFYPSKNLATYGDAGLVTTSDPDLARRLKALRVHGMEVRYQHRYRGWNARIDPLHAAMLSVKLPHLPEWLAGRQAAAKRYDALIQSAGLDGLLTRPVTLPGYRHVFNQYQLRVAGGQRDALMQHLKSQQIGCEIYYPIPIHRQESMQHLDYRQGDFPVSEAASEEVLALPMFPEISEAQQTRVVDTIASFTQQQRRAA